MATNIRGLRASMRASHDVSGIDFRPIQFNRDMAPMMSNWRMSLCPALETRPSRSLPPLECCFGTRPSQAALKLSPTSSGAAEKLSTAGSGLVEVVPPSWTVWRLSYETCARIGLDYLACD